MNGSGSPSTRILNALMFQLGWFACVLGAARGTALPGVLVVLLAVALACLQDERRARLLGTILLAVMIGIAFDGANMALDLLHPTLGGLRSTSSWLFIAALWANFGATLRSSLSFLGGRPLVAAALGLLGGPLAYLAGRRLGAVELGTGAIPALAVEWGVVTPLLVFFAHRDRSPS